MIQVVTFLGMGKWPVQKSSDLQLEKKGHFESPAKKNIMGNDQVNQMKKIIKVKPLGLMV